MRKASIGEAWPKPDPVDRTYQSRIPTCHGLPNAIHITAGATVAMQR